MAESKDPQEGRTRHTPASDRLPQPNEVLPPVPESHRPGGNDRRRPYERFFEANRRRYSRETDRFFEILNEKHQARLARYGRWKSISGLEERISRLESQLRELRNGEQRQGFYEW